MAARTAFWIAKFFPITFSFTAHANDIFAPRNFEIALEKLIQTARLIITETDYSEKFLRERFPERADRIHRIYNGLNLAEFGHANFSSDPPLIVAIGRLIAKKGFANFSQLGQMNWDGDPDLPLLWFLRDETGLTGTKYGCGQALCGACTVIVDKQAVRACITSVSDVVGREVTTIEGLHPTGDHAVQKAWRQLNVPQCGFCQAGQIMQAAALLIENPKPNHDQIREAMSGNICRCGCYQRIENAVHLASTGV